MKRLIFILVASLISTIYCNEMNINDIKVTYNQNEITLLENIISEISKLETSKLETLKVERAKKIRVLNFLNDDIEIGSIIKDKNSLIFSIKLKSNKTSTFKGISPGDEISKVYDVYPVGDPSLYVNNSYENILLLGIIIDNEYKICDNYEEYSYKMLPKGFHKIIFSFKHLDGIVTEIYIYESFGI